MLISCKCLNFVATSNSQQQPTKSTCSTAAVTTADALVPLVPLPLPPAATAVPPATVLHISDDFNMSVSVPTSAASSNSDGDLPAALMQAFLQKYPRTFVLYSQCMDFFKQSIGPIPELTINAINQRELVYSLTLDVQLPQGLQIWQISICINCNSALCAAKLSANSSNVAISVIAPQFLVNGALLTSNDELNRRRGGKSFSDAFGLLIMDHPQLQSGGGAVTLPASSNSFGATLLDHKQQRLRQLQQHLQERLKREIAETDERIQRYSEQQFALLKSFREKSEQECDLLLRLIQQVPEQLGGGAGLDQAPPSLEVTGGMSYTARRRNTISSRREMNASGAPTTPTTPNAPPAQSLLLAAAGTSAMEPSTQVGGAAAVTVAAAANSANRKMSNFDTPPATPEATPMSVGNSPTFRQQQQQQQQQPLGRLISSHSFQQQFPTPTVETADDCLFELEDVEPAGPHAAAAHATMQPALSLHLMQHQSLQPLQLLPHLQRNLGGHGQHHDMSDLEESDGAEEAEDALDMDSSMPIPLHAAGRRHTTASTATMAQMLNFGKSLPIEIANSPLAERAYMGESEEDDVDNTVDIAASIKALAKSVHGEAVFGDLPRPRLRSQI